MPSLSLSSPPAPPSPILNSNSMHHAARPLSRRTLPSPEHAADAALVTHILLLLTALFLLAILLRLPRALALFGGVSREWAAGHVFWYDRTVAAVAPSRRTRRGRRGTLSNSGNAREHSSGEEKDQGVPRARPYPALHFPPHIPSCPSLLRGLLAPLRARVPFLASTRGGAGMGMGHALLLAVYFYAWVYAALFRSNVFTDPARTGWIAAAQVPVVCALAGKNGVGWLGGWGYEKLNFIHRFVGRIIVLAANIHSLHYFYFWSINGTFKQFIQDPSNTWGMVALVSVNTIFLFSVQSVRNSAYNLFLATHILGFILVLPAMYLHKPSLLPYVLFAAAFLALDHTLRLLKSRYTSAYITPLPELEMTRVEIPSINAGWRAGQHVRLRVLAPWGVGAMGVGKCLEVHPFTIANVARKEGGEGMVLMCKKAGGWTGALYALAKAGAAPSPSPASLEAGCPQAQKTAAMGLGLGREVRVVVEGPYGGPGHVNFASFSAAVFVVGGSGITYALAAIEDLVRKDGKGESRVKVVEVVWIVADPACLAPLLPTFTKLISQSLYTPLRISVFYTRAPIGKQPAFFDASSSSSSPSSFSSSSASPPASPTAQVSASGPAPAYTYAHSSAPLAPVAEARVYTGESSANAHAKLRRGDSARARFADPAHDDREHGHGHDGDDNANGDDDEDDDDDDGYAPSVHSQDQNQHEFDSYARPQRAHESAHVRNASANANANVNENGNANANAVAGPSAAAIMHGQMQSHHLQPQPQPYLQPQHQSQPSRGNAPQRQDSSASARTLVGRENSTKSAHYHYRSKSISKSRARTPQPQVHIQGQAQGQGQALQHLPRGLTLAPGRPKLSKFLEHALQRAITLSHGNFKDNYDDTTSTAGGRTPGSGGGLSGMVVGVCGPGGLADDVVACVGSLDVRRRERVGGVEVCEEVFGW